MPRILVCNNYPLDRVWKEVELRETPDQGLFGINHFQRHGYEVKVIPFGLEDWGQRLNRLLLKTRLPIPLGDLSQEIRVLKQLNEADLIYAPCGEQTCLLHYLRTMGLVKVPIVCLMHHPFLKGKLDIFREPFRRWFVSGADALPALSSAVADDLRARFCAEDKAFPVAWGPDLSFYTNSKEAGQGVISAGRTGRDFVTFGRAASLTNSPATIVCLEGQPGIDSSQFGSNVKVLLLPNKQPVPGKKAGWMKYPELMALHAKARVVAIPLAEQASLAGLTSLMDALGMGKPVIMTRNRHIDLDIEAEGIGFWMEPGDVPGWKNAIDWFDKHEGEAFEMGHRARVIAESRLNSELFASRMVNVFDRLLNKTGIEKDAQAALQV